MSNQISVFDFHVALNELKSYHCPLCKSSLSMRTLVDTFVLGLSCENRHQYFCRLKIPVGPQQPMHLDKAVQERSIKDFIMTLFLEPSYRNALSTDLAEVLRRIEEDSIHDIRVNHLAGHGFPFCMICTEELQIEGTKDGWTRELRCINGHIYRERANSVDVVFNSKKYYQICKERSEGELAYLIESMLVKSHQLGIHPKIQGVLETALSELREALIRYKSFLESLTQ